MPDEDLPVNHKRGSTPVGESFVMRRQALDIRSVTAGSNPGKATASFDDDETTQWVSNGHINNAWIRYELGSNVTVHEVVLKVVGHRTKRYPITISVDDKVVYAGVTAGNLGYLTMTFQPTRGRSVKIASKGGGAGGKAASGNVLEIQQTRAGVASEAGPAGNLGLVEVEIYGSH
jgi:hypothetical protein